MKQNNYFQQYSAWKGQLNWWYCKKKLPSPWCNWITNDKSLTNMKEEQSSLMIWETEDTSYKFTPFWPRNTSMIIETFHLIFCAFMCAFIFSVWVLSFFSYCWL